MDTEHIRLDKWLWAARFYKTRVLAKQAIEGGKVRVNGHKAKPSKQPQPGDIIELRQGWDQKTIIVDQLNDKRKSAQEAQCLYHETEESIMKRLELAEQRKAASIGQQHPPRRPDKKQRRDIQRFKNRSME